MPDHTSSHFLDRFEELGLSRNEASVYLALLKNHPVTGYKLAKDSGILRPIVYETLTRLVEKGGVKITKASPEQYIPITPEKFLAILDKRFTDARVSLVEELSTYYEEKDNDNDDFWNISNVDTIIASIIDISQKAKKEIFFYLNNETYASLLRDSFSRSVATGKQVVGFSYRDLELPGTDLYTFKIPSDISDSCIDDHRILIVVDQKYSIIADMEVGKACQSMRPAQASTTQEFIQMKIVLYRMSQVLTPSKLSLYLFDQDKNFFQNNIKQL